MIAGGHTRKDLLLVLTAVVLTAVVFGCGKKGDPTLKSYERPETPSGLGIVHREDAMFISWAFPPAKEHLITQFIVLRSTGSEFKKLSPVDKEKRSYIDKEFAAGNTYEYKVIAQSLRGAYSADSAAASASPAQGPLPPAKLSYAVEGNSIILAWDRANTGALFNVYRSTEKGKYGMMPLNQSPLSEPRFKDTFSAHTVFYYTVRSLTGSSIRDEGPASEELTVDAADLMPVIPRNLQAFPAQDKVFLSWTELDEIWVTGFNVYRKIDSNAFILIGSTQTPAFLDPDPPASKRDYRITAIGIAKEGPAAEIRDIMYVPQR
ncbi:MAG: hypothetical protein HZB31_09335 [Nitrospirae bacterium]|nr:hypothetical protein [Nitrospirota bacterium]